MSVYNFINEVLIVLTLMYTLNVFSINSGVFYLYYDLKWGGNYSK